MKPTRKALISTCVVGAVLAGGVAVTATATMTKLRQATTEMTARHPGPDPEPATGGHESVDDTPGVADDTGQDSSADPDIGVPQEPGPGQTVEPWPTDRIQSVDPLPIPRITLSVLPPER